VKRVYLRIPLVKINIREKRRSVLDGFLVSLFGVQEI